MQSSDFQQYFNFFPNLKNNFKGVFSIDKIPKALSIRQFCVINTDLSTNSGVHWFIILKIEKNCLEIFDSLGFDIEKINLFKHHCKIKVKNIYISTNLYFNLMIRLPVELTVFFLQFKGII